MSHKDRALQMLVMSLFAAGEALNKLEVFERDVRAIFASKKRTATVALAVLTLTGSSAAYVGFLAQGADAETAAPLQQSITQRAVMHRPSHAEAAVDCATTSYTTDAYFQDIGNFAKINFGVVSVFDAEGRERLRRQSVFIGTPELLVLDDAGHVASIYNPSRNTLRPNSAFLNHTNAAPLTPNDPAYSVITESRRALAAHDHRC